MSDAQLKAKNKNSACTELLYKYFDLSLRVLRTPFNIVNIVSIAQ